MKRALLILRVPIETAFGLLYMSSLLLLPAVFRPDGLVLFLVGWLGMPRHTDGAIPNQAEIAAPESRDMLVGLLIVAFLVLNGLFWFKDVFHIIREIRGRHVIVSG